MDLNWSCNPAALQFLCMDVVVSNISLLLPTDSTAVSTEASAELVTPVTHTSTHVKCRNVLAVPLAELLLSKLSSNDKLTDDSIRAFIKAYDYSYRRLHFNLGSLLTPGGMLSLSLLNLTELSLSVSRSAPSSSNWIEKDLVSSFHNSAQTLKVLDLDLILLRGGGDAFDFITTFVNLRVLRLKSEMKDGCSFDSSTWKRLLIGCPQLEVLSVSFPRILKDIYLDSTVFHCYGHKSLKSISLYCALSLDQSVEREESLYYFGRLEALTHLDLSIDIEPESVFGDVHPHDDALAKRQEVIAKRVEELLEHGKDGLPSLVALDLSGLLRLRDSYLESFLETHPDLSFLGLCLTNSKYCLQNLLPPSTKVTGTHLQQQIVLSLAMYPFRETYLKEALKGLFHISSDWNKRQPKIVELVLNAMQNHGSSILLQMAGTACLYNLTREREDLQGEDVHITLLNKTAELTAAALTRGLGTIQIVKNCLLIFCNDKILHQANFDRFNMIRICLDCMHYVPESRDLNVTRMAVAIVSILACKITSHETAELTKEKDMKLLLELLKRRINYEEADGTMKFDLSALWNLTDESPKACEMFVKNAGMDLYVSILKTFKDHSVQTKILGLLNNIAEVDYLLDSLLRLDLLEFVRELITDEHVAVSYFSAGIVANLLYVWKDEWSSRFITKTELCSKLALAVKEWGTLDYEIVTYRSFRPFLNLLDTYSIPEVQSWAVWAIHHVCSLNPQRYSDVLTDECYQLLLELKNSSCSSEVMKQKIIEIGEVSKRSISTSNS